MHSISNSFDERLSDNEIRKYEKICNYISTIDEIIGDQIANISNDFSELKYHNLLRNICLYNQYKDEIRGLSKFKKKLLKPILYKYGLY